MRAKCENTVTLKNTQKCVPLFAIAIYDKVRGSNPEHTTLSALHQGTWFLLELGSRL